MNVKEHKKRKKQGLHWSLDQLIAYLYTQLDEIEQELIKEGIL